MEEGRSDSAYRSRIEGYSLAELEDLYDHVDRVAFPERFNLIESELDRRLQDLESSRDSETEVSGCAPILRRVWANLLDFYLVLLLLTIFSGTVQVVLVRAGLWPAGLPGVDRAFFSYFLDGLLSGDVGVLGDVESWKVIGVGLLGYLIVKGAMVIPVWRRSGATPGMREADIRLGTIAGGRLSTGQALLRFAAHYVLSALTLGISAIWMFWDDKNQSLHDKLSGTVVRKRGRPAGPGSD